MFLWPALNQVKKIKKPKPEPLDDRRSSDTDLLAEGFREKIACLFRAGQCLLQKKEALFPLLNFH